MPAPVPTDPRSKRLLTALFWGGVALAPVAALILLVADGNGPLRFAAVLAIMAVVLIGLSIALRTEGGVGHAEDLRAELDELQRELRAEIVAAAQRGNQALDEANRVQEALAGLRRRVDAGVAGPGVGGETPGAGRARVAAPGPEVPPHHAERPAGQAGVYAAAPVAGHGVGYDDDQPEAAYPADRERVPAAHGADRASAGPAGDRPVGGSAGGYGSAGRPEHDNRARPEHDNRARPEHDNRLRPEHDNRARSEHDSRHGEPAPRPLGMVRHTETVHVTTRHTIVDGGVGESGSRYGGYAAPWSPQQEERPRAGHGAERDDRSWPEPEERFRRDDDRSWSGPGREEDRHRPDARNEPHWSGHRDERTPPRDEHPAPRADRAAYQDDRVAPRDEYPGHRNEHPGHRDDRDWAAPRAESGWDDRGQQQWDVPAEPASSGAQRPDDTGEYWAQMRAGDRWATVRDDDRGHELRVGERRAEVHTDNTGTEYRMADRWASVRRDEPRRGADSGDGWRDGRDEPEHRPALPAGGVPVPQEWRPPRQRGYQPEPARQHQPASAYGHQPDPAYEHQAEAAYGHQPDPAYGHQAEPAYGHQPEPRAGGYPPEGAWGPQPEPEPYGRRRQHTEEPGYGQPPHDAASNRWR